MSFYQSAGSSRQFVPAKRSEFDILKVSHKFLREDNEGDSHLSWDDKLARKYYESLYREYAVCDLKHYKSGNFSLRWRTENEVISGAGETTCGNTRCALHDQRGVDEVKLPLKTLELPFSYVEGGENKFALVKVVLCDKCLKKLMWKRAKEKEKEKEADVPATHGESVKSEENQGEVGALADHSKWEGVQDAGAGKRSLDREKARRKGSVSRSREEHRERVELDRSSRRRSSTDDDRRRRNSRSRSPVTGRTASQRRAN